MELVTHRLKSPAFYIINHHCGNEIALVRHRTSPRDSYLVLVTRRIAFQIILLHVYTINCFKNIRSSRNYWGRNHLVRHFIVQYVYTHIREGCSASLFWVKITRPEQSIQSLLSKPKTSRTGHLKSSALKDRRTFLLYLSYSLKRKKVCQYVNYLIYLLW
jgi:hypothetical protein